MKRFYKSIATALIGVFATGLSGCERGGVNGGEEKVVAMELSLSLLTFDADGVGEAAVVKVTGSGWRASVDGTADWIAITPASGDDGGEFTVAVTATDEAREGSVRVVSTEDASVGKIVEVVQQGRQESVMETSASSLAFDADGIGEVAVVRVTGSGWSASVDGAPEWITVTPASGDDGGEFTVYVTQTDESRNCNIRVVSSENATLERIVEVVQQGRTEEIAGQAANCYIVRPGCRVIIPVSRAYDAWRDYFGEPVGTAEELTAELLWMDTPGGISSGSAIAALSMFNPGDGENAGIRVVAGSGEGNALVALKADGATVWSWHIWVTAYDPESENVSIPGAGGAIHVMMNRNLGALNATPGDVNSLGTGYQYGRKDPFPSSDGVRHGSQNEINPARPIYDGEGRMLTVGEGGTGIQFGPQIHEDQVKGISYSVQNPTLYIKAYTGGYPQLRIWTSITGNLNPGTLKMDMWGSNSAGDDMPKTLFDPCPAGYRVPYDPEIATTLQNKEAEKGVEATLLFGEGRDYDEYGYFPFAGFIEDATYGYYVQMGWWGGFWLNRPGGFGGRTIAFSQSDGTLNSTQSYVPACGFSVRCEKEW